MLPKTPSFRLDGRTALVTGAGRGLGIAGAAALAEAGAEVTLCARTLPELEAVAAEIIARGGKAHTLQVNLRNTDELKAALKDKPFDILLNNAGNNVPKPFTEITEADYDKVLDLNLKSAYFVAQAVAQSMIAAGRGGSIIHTSSQMGFVGGATRTLYCASKWGIEGLNKAMALDLAPYKIRSNTIAPTFVETAMTKPFFENKTFRDDVMSKIKLGRLGQLEDIMGAIVFLASDAASLITGTSIVIDGGWTAE